MLGIWIQIPMPVLQVLYWQGFLIDWSIGISLVRWKRIRRAEDQDEVNCYSSKSASEDGSEWWHQPSQEPAARILARSVTNATLTFLVSCCSRRKRQSWWQSKKADCLPRGQQLVHMLVERLGRDTRLWGMTCTFKRGVETLNVA